ncbi:transcriptional regulator [Streptosporangium sp. NPDC049078]|uniref:transcriptional regulator n=1 Tax=Streptosporangium sp. NPDC049078 TaxID=3155767 RepID=UPI00343D9FC9
MTVETLASLATFAATFGALLAAHSVGDHWVQTHGQACAKGAPGWAGRIACAKHVATLTITKVVAVALVMLVTGLRLDGTHLLAGLLIDAASHYWADRAAGHEGRTTKVTLELLAKRLKKSGFYALGDRLTAPTGTGAYSLDQSWHVAWLFVTALVVAGGA